MSCRSCAVVVFWILVAFLLLGPALVVAQTQGLVAGYTFDATSGTTALDASGNGNNGVLTNGPVWVGGHNGNGVRLDGGNDYVNLGNPASLRLTGSMTLSAWINSSVFPFDDAAIISKRQSSSTGYQLDTTIDRGPRTIGFKIADTAGNHVARYGATAMVVNTWYHVAGVYDATNRTLTVYLNGQVDNGALEGIVPAAQRNSTQNVNIGQRPGVPGTFNFAGVVDDVRIYDRALTLAEIQSDMATPVGGPPAPDTTAPTAAITTPTAAASFATNASPLTLGGTAADNIGVMQVTWSNDRGGSGTAVGTTSWSASGIVLQPGPNVLTVTARDAAGNLGPATLTVTYDATVPTVVIATPTAGATYTTNASPLTLGGTAADNIGVTQVTWANDRGGSGTAVGTTSWSASGIVLQPGSNVLTITARDATGATGTATLTVTYTAPDTTTPTVVITTPTAAASFATNASPLTLGGTAADNVGVTQVTWVNARGGSGTAVGTTSWAVSGLVLQLGTNVLTVTARDAAGNAGIATLTVSYDSAPPSVSLTGPTSGSTVSGTTLVTATASDDIGVVGVQFLLDSSPLGAEQTGPAFSLSWTTTAVPNGAHTLSARARDAAGNTTLASDVTVTVANTQLSGLVAGYTFDATSGTTALDASGNGNNGVLTNGPVWVGGHNGNGVRLDGGNDYVNLGNPASLRLTGSMTLSAWINSSVFPFDDAAIISKRQSSSTGYQLDTTIDRGPRTIGFKIADTAGNHVARYGATAMVVNTWYHVAGVYDATNRTLTVYLNGQVDNGALEGIVPAAQRNSTQNVNIGQRPGVPGTFNFAGVVDDVRIYDRALTLAEIQSDMATPVGGPPAPDTTAPTAAITTPTAAASFATNASPLTLGGTAADNIGVMQVTWSNDRGGSGTAVGTTSWSASGIVLQPGPNVLTVTARDAAGNLGPATLTVTYDATVPTVVIATPTAGATYTTNASPLTLGGTAADNIGVTQVTWANDRGGSGTAVGTTSWSASGIVLQPGSNVLTITARDATGATGTATLTVTYTAPDTTTPTVVITTPTAAASFATNASPLTLGGTAADNVGVTQVTWVNARGGSGTAVGTTSWAVSGLVLQLGTNVLTVTARDAAGNAGIATLTVSYDSAPPSVSLTGPTSGSTVSGTTLVTATASDDIGVVGVQFLLDSSPLGAEQTGPAFSLSWTTTAVPNGAHTLSARARDAAGNTTLASDVTVTVANTQLSGLVAGYTFDATSGTTALDASGNGNNGVLTNGPVWVGGHNGNGVRLDGGNDYVNLGNPASLRLTGSMTLSAWINSSVFPFDDAAIISKRQSSSTGYQLDTTIDRGPRTIGFKIADTAGNHVARYGATAMVVNTWYHVAGVYDATNRTLTVYLNGQVDNGALEGIVPAAQLDSTQNVNIGQRPGQPGFVNFAGVVDDVRIYDRALTLAEIQSDMATPVGGTSDPTPPMVAINAPPAGSTVFSLVSVSAAVSDNVGIAGIQFYLDDTTLGVEVTSAPYAVLWDTTNVSPGSQHDLTVVARDFAGNLTTSTPITVTVLAPATSLVGQWNVNSAPVTWPIVAVNASLLPTGEVLAWDGQGSGYDARLWNPTSGVFSAAPNNQTNMFCAGQCSLADGKTLVAGGHAGAHVGVKDTNLFDPVARTWTKVGAMLYPRWYPTTTTLPDGHVLVTAGEINCNRCTAVIPEVYNPQTRVWTQLSGASLDLPYYPHMFVLPDGRVLAAATAEDPIITYALNISTQTWSVIDSNPVDGGSSVMYLPGKVMKSGTSTDPDMPIFASETTTYVLDMTRVQPPPAWKETAPMAFPRTFHTLTLLPDGTVLATGGGVTTDAIGVSGAVHHAELWSPVSETWTTMASMQKPRLYHSTALLLPDGRVLAAGGGRFNGPDEPTNQLNSETYSPPYLFKGARPTISSAPATATYGGTIAVLTPDAAQIEAVTLIKLGAVTHAFNMDQRFLELPFTTISGALDVQAPDHANLAPPGYYMLFILNTNGVPSVAAILQLQ